MSIGMVLSRATGVVRLAVLAATLGIAETRLTDTYNLANMVPNVIYELVLGGVITSVFVPLFVELLEKEDRERAWEVFSAILTVSLLVLAGIALLALLGAPLIARFYAMRLEGGDVAAQEQAITLLLRLFVPQIVLYGVFFIVAGWMNAHKRFLAPTYTPILNNLVLIGVFLVFRAMYERVTLGTVSTTQLLIIGAGTTLSVAPMGVALIPPLLRLGRYRPSLAIRDPAVTKLLRLSGYVIGMVAVGQISYIVVQWLANAQQGGYTAYISAFTFFLLPVGLFVVTLTTALLPDLSGHAVNERWGDYVSRLSVGLRSTFFLLLPASVGMFILAEPIVEVSLLHGVATPASTELVTDVLRFFLLGLVQFSLYQLLIRAYYALQDTKTPFWINCAVVAVNTGVNVPMFVWLDVAGLAAGQALAYTLGVFLQMRLLAKRTGGLDGRRVVVSFVRIVGATAAMGGVVWALGRALEGWASTGLLAQALALVLTVGVGLAAFLAASMLLKVDEMRYVTGLLQRRVTRSSAS